MSEKCTTCSHTLTDEQIELLVEKVIDTMTKRAYQEVGHRVVGGLSKFFFYVGVVTFALYTLLKSKGIIS